MRILITGTTNGIGFATARALHAAGHELIMINRNADRAESVKKMFESTVGTGGKKGAGSGAGIYSFIADFSDLDSVSAVCKSIKTRFDSIDVLVNNAGLFCDLHGETVQGLEMTIGVMQHRYY